MAPILWRQLAWFVSGLLLAAAGLVEPLLGQELGASLGGKESAKEEAALEALKSLMEVQVVTASKFRQDQADAPGVITVVTADEIERFGGITLRDVLARVPSLALTTGMASDRTMIAVRGDQIKNEGSHVLFLINGRPIREPLEGGIMTDLLEGFPLHALERIEVIRGPGSVLYGTNAFSGVVNLITKQASGTNITARAFSGQASSPVGGGGAEVSFKRGDLSIFGAGQFRQGPTLSTLHPAALSGQNLIYQPADLQDRGQGAFFQASFKRLSVDFSWTQAHGNSTIPQFQVGEIAGGEGSPMWGTSWSMGDAGNRAWISALPAIRCSCRTPLSPRSIRIPVRFSWNGPINGSRPPLTG